MHRWFASRRLGAAAIALVATAVLLASTARDRPTTTAAERWVLDALAPVTGAAHQAVEVVRQAFDRLRRLDQLYEENQALRAQLAEYQRMEQAYNQTRASYERLRQLLALKQWVGVPVVAANVIGRNPDQWFDMLLIDAGTRDGVRVDMVVVDARGVVGRVIRVSERTATVMLLTDPQSGVGVMLEGSRDAGVVTGSGGEPQLLLRFFPRFPQVQVGDRVVTSGYGTVFPPGLPVGEVIAVERDAQGLVVQATVRPAVDFDRLSEVLVLRTEVLPPGDGGQEGY